MRKFSLPAVIVAFLLLPVYRAQAWIDTGHKVVAFIAWEDLTPKTRAAITEALKQHPRYKEDLLIGANPDAAGEELDRQAFAGAATWPDTVKQYGNPMRVQFNHQDWHYIDIPLDVDNQPLPTPRAEKNPDQPHDILTALAKETAVLKDANAAPLDRAVAICWVAHLVGDIHQPLHCAEEISPQFPRGDQGGNAQIVLEDVRYQDTRKNLHFIWDALPGDFYSDELDRAEAIGLRADPHYARDTMKDQLAITDFAKWADESHTLAVKDAYLDGKIKSATAKGHSDAAPGATIPALPPGYLENAEHIAMHQVTLGGYRLADLLNSIFDPK